MSVFKFVVLALISIAMFSNAHASIITYTYTANRDFGTIDGTDSTASIANSFASISGTLSYDTSTPDTNPAVDAGAYATGSITVNEFILPTYNIMMSIFDSPSSEQFSLGDQSTNEQVLLSLQSINGSALVSDALPETLSLAAFNALNELQFFSSDGFTQFTLTSLALAQNASVATPAPAALVMFLTGILGARFSRQARLALN